MSRLDEIIRDINKEAKEEIISHGLNSYDYKRIPFSSLRMNYCTYGGIPVGKITEFSGEDHGGKTTTALDIVANYQRGDDDRKVLYVDAENTLDTVWATKLGVNVEDMIILQPKSQSAEYVFQKICDIVDTGEIGLWILDSIGVLLSQQEFEKDIEEKTYGGIAKSLTIFSKKIEMLMAKYQCTGIGINQVREVIGSMFPKTDTPGGKAWKHVCSVRLQFSAGRFIDENGKEISSNSDNIVGNVIQMAVLKNKTCPRDRRLGSYKLYYHSGIDYMSDVIDLGILYGIIDQKGAWFKIVDTETGEILRDKIHGQPELRQVLDDESIYMRVNELIEKEMQK